MRNTLIAFVIFSFLVLACQKSETPAIKEPVADPILKSQIVAQSNDFAVDIFKQIAANDNSGDNIFISPLSMYYALNMAGIGANGQTRAEFSALLGWPRSTDSVVFATMKQLYTELIPESDAVMLEIANSLWQRQGFPIYADYKTNIATWFNGDISELDFNNPESVSVINNWIADKTHDKIQNMLTEISPNAVMFLVNAIYFKGDWKYKFDKQYTTDASFYKENGEIISTPFMNAKPTIKYHSNDDCRLISLPYADSVYSMLLIMPNNSNEVGDIISKLDNATIKGWQQAMTYEDVEVSLPRFKFTYGTRDIIPELKSLGLSEAFDSENADFSNITPERIFISLVLHKAFIEVNEDGSEAAAATIIGFDNTSIEPEKPTFMANRPFLFAICHQPSNTVLFIGKVAFPEQ